VAKRHAGSLASDLQPDLAKACADETHEIKLYECRAGKRNFRKLKPRMNTNAHEQESETGFARE
jgi:hypothetical protein